MDFNRFRPKRSAARWLQKAPEYVIACYDNGGKSADRYVVLLGGTEWTPDYAEANYQSGQNPQLIPCISMSGAPTHPQGISIWCSALRGPHLGKKINWLDLPKHIREHVKARVESSYEGIT